MELEFGSVDASPKQWVPAPLPYPTGVNRNRIYWRYELAVGGYHMLGLLAFVPWFFSWQGAVLAIVGTYLFGAVGINLCYHRLLSHRSFCTPLWLAPLFALSPVCVLEGTPRRGEAGHRTHHP